METVLMNDYQYVLDRKETKMRGDHVIVVGVDGSLTQHGRTFKVRSVAGNTIWTSAGQFGESIRIIATNDPELIADGVNPI